MHTPAPYIQVIVTTAAKEEAEAIALRLLETRLAASVQISPCRSLYRWRGEIREKEELRLNIKSRRDLLPELTAAVRDLHSYEVPEILALPILDAAPSYLDWLALELKGEGGA